MIQKWMGRKADILAEDGQGKQFNVEVQRKDSGADERRARFHSGMIDSRMLVHNQDFNCKKSKDMYHKELADGVRHFKEEGRGMVCEAVEEYCKE